MTRVHHLESLKIHTTIPHVRFTHNGLLIRSPYKHQNLGGEDCRPQSIHHPKQTSSVVAPRTDFVFGFSRTFIHTTLSGRPPSTFLWSPLPILQPLCLHQANISLQLCSALPISVLAWKPISPETASEDLYSEERTHIPHSVRG